MSQYAPVTRIAQIFGDPLTATDILLLPGDGDIFVSVTTPPFTALIWPTQQPPIVGNANPHQATNAEEITVTAVQDDHVTIVRSATPIAIGGGLMFAMIAAQPVLGLGEVFTISDTIPAGVAPFKLKLFDPLGFTYEVDGLPGVSWEGTAGMTPVIQSGQYTYIFSDANGKTAAEQDLFIASG